MGALLLPVTVLAASPARTRQHRPLRPAAHPAPDYNRDVRPILAEHCFACHGVDGNQRRAALRLDRREDALAPAASGRPAVRPGNAAASELVRRIRATDARVMPPPSTHRKLSPQQVSTLTRWVEAGAPYAPHWSYLPPRRTPPPPVRAAAWPVNAVDRFVLARLEREGLRPAPDADRATLLRRVSFDLTGLPPTRQELDAFLADRSPGAYERVVDRLLASPHYGERMAVFWLDLARYADTDGYHGDRHRSVYPYRDWVIHAFNSNMPFDQFTAEQLAGDLLPQATVGQRIASTFNRLNMTTREGGAQPREYLAKYASERVRTTSQVWLGTTLGCAECHDHKYDPFTTRDFYRFAAYFADIQQVGLYPNDREDLDPILRLPTPEQDAAWTALESRLAALRARAASEPAEEKALKEQVAALEKERAELDRAVSRTLVTAALPEPMVTRILPRGNWMDESGEVVSPAPPPTLGAPPAAPRRLNRLDLAMAHLPAKPAYLPGAGQSTLGALLRHRTLPLPG
jgi:mono/diheme cytochrome c family protein